MYGLAIDWMVFPPSRAAALLRFFALLTAAKLSYKYLHTPTILPYYGGTQHEEFIASVLHRYYHQSRSGVHWSLLPPSLSPLGGALFGNHELYERE